MIHLHHTNALSCIPTQISVFSKPRHQRIRRVNACRFATVLIATVLVAAGAPSIVPAMETVSASEDAAELVLTEYWDNSSESRDALDHYINGIDMGSAPPSLSYAIGLTKLNHRKYVESIEWMASTIINDENHLQARRSLVWLLARTKQHHRSMDELSELATLVASAEDTISVEDRDELVRFSGRMMGFFAGPAADSMTPATLDRYSREIVEAFDDDSLAVFDEERNAVLATFGEFDDERTEEQDRALEEAEEEQEELIRQLTERREVVIEELGRIGPVLAETRATARNELDSIRSRGEPLEDQIVVLENRAIALNTELGLIINDINRLEFRAANEQDPDLRRCYLRDADSLRFTARDIDSDLIRTNRELSAIVGRYRQIQAEFNRVENRYGREIGQLESQEEAGQSSLRRIDGQLNRARRGPDPDQRRSRSLNLQLNAITTYDEFPLDQQRRLLLRGE